MAVPKFPQRKRGHCGDGAVAQPGDVVSLISYSNLELTDFGHFWVFDVLSSGPVTN
jgi:hypothetical protein